ncbi:OmpA family protein [Nonomuraea sp. 3-1Str]|uniref:OmpA family protein n=1 Tax=Nonomuraea sp. 3-1Str TaxID=2929801 RepID=UPI002860F5A7|nr:OmpA family protein [Nonomuraea sp. 3-1Str]MDR8414359.1 OmpA family protein [Nonomuraea sp. 3-1Str]
MTTLPSSAPPSSTAASSAAQDTRPALARTSSTMTENLKVEVVGLNRVKGKHLIAQVRLTNTGSEKRLPWTGELGDNTRPLGEIRWASGIGVLDARARTWILPYQPADFPCLCSDQDRDGLGYFIDPGESISLYAVMPAPSGDPSTATVVTPVGPPMVEVPISDDPPVTPPGMTIPDPDAEPVTTVTRRLVAPSESLDRSEETADDGTDLHVNLSSDLLFAVNKATLTPRAKVILARTAKLVDASSGATVQVEGHADSSGNDAINDPLSTRRAQAVRQALSRVVTRQGVDFQAEGYGSRRPLYSNDTDEGRRRNRRVTVTFAKPQPAATVAPSTTPAPGATGLTGTGKADGQPISMEITGLRKLPGGLGLLTYRITNQGAEEAWFNELHHAKDWMSFKYQAAFNVTLTDVEARRRYLPARLQVADGDSVDSYCACTDVSGVRLSTEKFGPGRQREFWSLFALPETAGTLKVKIADFADLQVPVG